MLHARTLTLGMVLLLAAALPLLMPRPGSVPTLPPLAVPQPIDERDENLRRAISDGQRIPLEGRDGVATQLEPSYAAGDQFSTVDVPELPDFPDICREIETITGQPCRWHVEHGINRNGFREMKVWIGSGDHVIALGEYVEMDAATVTDGILNGTVWAGRIETLRTFGDLGLRLQGLGKLIWSTGDSILRYLYGPGLIRYFIDTTATPTTPGWGASLLRYVTAQQIDFQTWLYQIP